LELAADCSYFDFGLLPYSVNLSFDSILLFVVVIGLGVEAKICPLRTKQQ